MSDKSQETIAPRGVWIVRAYIIESDVLSVRYIGVKKDAFAVLERNGIVTEACNKITVSKY